MIHKLADVQSNTIGEGTSIWQFSIVLERAQIGKNCNINCHVFIENDVIIGDNVTVKSGVYLWDGICLCDHIFIGPNVSFTNDKLPRSKRYPTEFQKIRINNYVSIGAGAIILGGIEIGEFAMIGAGTLVTKSVPARALVVGTPGKIVGWVNDDGTKMLKEGDYFIDNQKRKWVAFSDKLKLL